MGEQHQGQPSNLGDEAELLQPEGLTRVALSLGCAIEGEQGSRAATAACAKRPPGQKHQQASGRKDHHAADQGLGLIRQPKPHLQPEAEF